MCSFEEESSKDQDLDFAGPPSCQESNFKIEFLRQLCVYKPAVTILNIFSTFFNYIMLYFANYPRKICQKNTFLLNQSHTSNFPEVTNFQPMRRVDQRGNPRIPYPTNFTAEGSIFGESKLPPKRMGQDKVLVGFSQSNPHAGRKYATQGRIHRGP